MSYSRWGTSNWYVYEHVDGWIECDLRGYDSRGIRCFQWKPREEDYEEFMAYLAGAGDVPQSYIDELREILEPWIDEIVGDFL